MSWTTLVLRTGSAISSDAQFSLAAGLKNVYS
jgi:hypothetical protein